MTTSDRRRPFSQADQEALMTWMKDANAASVALPLKLHKNYTLTGLDCECSFCHTKLEAENIFFKCIRPTKDVATIEARGGCMKCKTLNAYLMRIRDDGGFDRLVDNQWESGRLRPDRIRWWDLINIWRALRTFLLSPRKS